MSDIFLSYASEDRERVRPLAEALMQKGWSVFWDRTIPLGKMWHKMLSEELDACRCFVVVWSKHSLESEWVLEEAELARRKGLAFAPILVDAVEPPLGFQLIQAADLSAWDGSPTSPLFQNLARDIKKILGPPAIPEPPKPATPEPVTPKPAEPRKPETPKQMKRGRAVLIGVPAGLALLLLMLGLWWFFGGRQSPQETFTNSLGMKFVLIPAGTFKMGSPADEPGRDDNERQHKVTISQPFYLQTTEVTQGQWQKVMGNNPSDFKKCGEGCPVEQVSWFDAQKFIKKLNQMEKTDKYRLPTEAEWEYACRADSTSRFTFGDDETKLKEFAWYEKNSGDKPHPVGQLNPNAWGLFDMHGNVWEWCQEGYDRYPVGSVTDPKGPASGEEMVLRGGSWGHAAKSARSAFRYGAFPVSRTNYIGFRVVKAL